jgi:murein DD-endopeptidase MepM/ murein hydrolase activator NlpD
VSGVLAVPVLIGLIGLGAGQSSREELESLRAANENLQVENDSYRAATGELASQISTLQTALTQLGEQAELDAVTRRAIESLPAVVKSRAMGGAEMPSDLTRKTASKGVPESTFGVLQSLLGAIENRLTSVRGRVESQKALARATPSFWPLRQAWLSSGYGTRKDPFTGLMDFHAGLDLSADRGTPVLATADGVVESAGYNGNYGNSIVLTHGYGIATRFGHLSGYAIRIGQQVKRGDVIGYVGATGRATSAHLHYEILVGGRPINPLSLLSKP